jgi:hypothetical protein
MITVSELVLNRGLTKNDKVKIVRHKDKRCNIFDLITENHFELYQSFQSANIFDCDYIISCLGLESTQALFYNVYKVKGMIDPLSPVLPESFPFKNFAEESKYCYVLEKVEGFEDLSFRVIVEWGKGALAWVQNSIDKEVIEILPKGYVREFPGYLNIVLSFEELVQLVENPASNRIWVQKLSAVNGLYIILDKKTGQQYVGSAYGSNGVWGRWSTYAKTRHGGNESLIALCENEGYERNFQFSLLHTFSPNTQINDVIEMESIFKKKFGSRAFGLNMN